MQRDPPPFIWAVPEENNILTCECVGGSGRSLAHLRACRELHHRTCALTCCMHTSALKWLPPGVQRGPPDSPFAGGEYHGVLLFPSEYPFKPPGIKV